MVMWGLVVIGCVWGSTNALIKRGAQIAQRKEKERDRKENEASSSFPSTVGTLDGAITWLACFVKEWLHLLSVWEYSIPFMVNLSASVLFIRALGDSPINVAVPVTNATTFAVTAVAGAALGEQIHIREALVGVALIALGIVLCIVPGIVL